MRYIFVITGYDDDILAVQEVFPDMEEVEEKKNLSDYDSILNNCKVVTLVKYSDFEQFDMSKNMITSQEIIKYNPHEIIAWVIFNDEDWMKENYDGPIDEPNYY